ncbi:MAG: hypothetical protein WAL55_06305, partial [Candidatus Acidiferrales bacterium]
MRIPLTVNFIDTPWLAFGFTVLTTENPVSPKFPCTCTLRFVQSASYEIRPFPLFKFFNAH